MGAYGGGDSLITGVFDGAVLSPSDFALLQNYPNPFNAKTAIRFIVPERSYFSITVYNILGQEVEELYSGFKQPGVHTISWNAGDYPSGVYFARLEVGDISKNVKMILLK